MANQQQLQQPEMKANDTDGGLCLPPGFRFHPSDDEIVTYYLSRKVCDRHFTCNAIGEVDLNRTEPWDLPDKAKMGEKEFYFFYKKDCKYPMGLRANRTTDSGFWKATGKDKEVYHTTKDEGGVLLVGMKKTLVFYKGRAPRGLKTDWVMHEYRLEGNDMLHGPASASSSLASYIAAMKVLAYASKNEWLICRVFHKTIETKKVVAPEYQVGMVGAEIDQNQNVSGIPIPMPMPLTFLPNPVPFPMPDFAMDPVAPYPNADSAQMMPPMAGFGGAGWLQNNDAMFGNPIAALPPMNFYHQMGMGEVGGQIMGMGGAPGQIQMGMGAVAGQMGMGEPGAGGFDVVVSESQPSSMVQQKDDEDDNVGEISSIMSMACLGSGTTAIDMDGMWKY